MRQRNQLLYPRAKVATDVDTSPADARMQLFSTITHITGVTGKDDLGRLMVEWTEAIPHEGTPPFPHLDVQPGKTMRLGSPAGISGGAVVVRCSLREAEMEIPVATSVCTTNTFKEGGIHVCGSY